tara:strand:- start:964 stop:2139 length:1176 start_codon:yes stop_codon:yes gene_type:complete
MGFLNNLGKKQAPVAPPGVVRDNSMGLRPMRQQPRPSLVVGGPAYFTPEGYEAPRQPEQAFMPTDTRPDPIGEQFRRERPTLPPMPPAIPPMPPAITGTDLGLPMNPGIPAPGGVEMGQPFQFPVDEPIGDTPRFLDFFNQQGMDDEPTGLRKLFGINEFLKKINESKTPDSPENDYFGNMGMFGMSADALKGMGGTPQPSTGGGFFGRRNSEMADDGTQLNNQPFGGLTIEEAIASSGRVPGQYSVDPKDDRGSFDPRRFDSFPPPNMTPIDYGPGGRGYPTKQIGTPVKQKPIVPIPNASPVTPEQEALIAEMTQPRSVDEAPVLTPEQEVFINGLMPGSGGYLTVPSIPSMPLPMMPAPPAIRPAPPPMMPRQTPNLSTRRMNPRFTR